MKIRNGFVSNSSSSSFIVCWNKKPESVEEVKSILFNNMNTVSYYDYVESTQRLAEEIFNDTKEINKQALKDMISEQYDYWDGSWYSKGYKADEKLCKQYEKEYNAAKEEEEILKNLEKKYNDFEKNRIIRKRKLENILNLDSLNNYEKEYLDLINKLDELRQILWGYNDTMNKLIDDSYNKFIRDNKGKFIVHYEYSDNDGSLGCVLEHGDCFNNVEHERISHH